MDIMMINSSVETNKQVGFDSQKVNIIFIKLDVLLENKNYVERKHLFINDSSCDSVVLISAQ
jgi:hypothetical protein